MDCMEVVERLRDAADALRASAEDLMARADAGQMDSALAAESIEERAAMALLLTEAAGAIVALRGEMKSVHAITLHAMREAAVAMTGVEERVHTMQANVEMMHLRQGDLRFDLEQALAAVATADRLLSDIQTSEDRFLISHAASCWRIQHSDVLEKAAALPERPQPFGRAGGAQ